jgi:hypothetical protein
MANASSMAVLKLFLTMSVNAPITSIDCRTEVRSHTHRTFPDGFVTFIRFTFRAREVIVTAGSTTQNERCKASNQPNLLSDSLIPT